MLPIEFQRTILPLKNLHNNSNCYIDKEIQNDMNIQKYNKNKLLVIHSSSNQLSILIRYKYIENLSIPYYVSIYWKENTLAVGSHCHLTKPKKNKKNLKTSLSLLSKLFMCPNGHRFKFHKEESCAALCPNINSIFGFNPVFNGHSVVC